MSGRKEDPNSMIGRIRAWFLDKENLAEHLTISDVSVKFGLTRLQAKVALVNLQKSGVVESAYVYRKALTK